MKLFENFKLKREVVPLSFVVVHHMQTQNVPQIKNQSFDSISGTEIILNFKSRLNINLLFVSCTYIPRITILFALRQKI
jgi:hypothetical protein